MPYSKLQLLPILTHWQKNLSIDLIIGLSISTNWKEETYNSILVIINRLTKIVHYELVKVTIDASRLVKVIINIIVQHHNFSDSIITDYRSVFTLKFWFSPYYFFESKQRLSTTFQSQINRQIEHQNSPIEAYF